MYNYVGILNKSSAVSKALICNFLSIEKPNLVLAKGNMIEIYNITNDGLQSTPYLSVFGKIIILEKVPGLKEVNNNQITSKDQVTDSLFILTEDLDFSIVTYNKTRNEIINLEKGSVKEDIGKRQEKVFSEFEVNYDYALISAYKNIFKVVFLKNRSKQEDFSVRYDYDDLLFMFPLFTQDMNTNTNDKQLLNVNKKPSHPSSGGNLFKSQNFGILKVTSASNMNNLNNISENKVLKFEAFNFDLYKSNVNKNVPIQFEISDPTISMIIPLKLGGMIVFYSNYLKYYSFRSSPYDKLVEVDSKSYSDRKFVNFCEIDSYRYLAVDDVGNLFLIALKLKHSNTNNIVNNYDMTNYSIILQFLGEVNYTSSLTYLDNNYIFIGSEKANSQLVKITKIPTGDKIRPFINIIEEYENLAPVSDFTILNSQGEEGSTEILCVSGDTKSCSLKTIRKGTSINVEAQIPISGTSKIFAIKFNDSNSMHVDDESNNKYENQKNLVFLSFVESTYLIRSDLQSASLSCYYNDNIIISEPTLLVEEFVYNGSEFILQVTNSFISIYDENLNLVNRVKTMITPVLMKYKKKKGFLYIYNKNNIFLRYTIFEMIEHNQDQNKLHNPDLINDDVKISSFCVSDDLIVFSEWDKKTLFIYSMKTKKTGILCEIDSDSLCSSLQIIKNEGIKFLFVSLGSGKMLYFKIKTNFAKNLTTFTYTAEDFVLKRKYNISKSPFTMKKVKCHDKTYLFINSDLPALISINKESLNISNFNIKECEEMTNMPGLNNLYLFLFKECIFLGGLSNSESQNVVTKHMGNKIYNLTNLNIPESSQSKNSLNLICYTQEERTNSRFSFVIIDRHSNEISRYKFENEEEVCMTFHVLEDPNLLENLPGVRKIFVLGTGILESPLEEPKEGHLIFLALDDNFRLSKILEIETQGGVYKITGTRNLLYVAICSTLFIYSVDFCTNKGLGLKLLRKCNEFTIINDLYCHDDYIVISDVYKSLSIYKFDEEKEKFSELCRDFNPIWLYSMTKVDNNIYMCSDIDGNILSFRRELHPRSDEEKYKLERVAQFNLGEKINKMKTIEKTINYKDWENIFKWSDDSNQLMNIKKDSWDVNDKVGMESSGNKNEKANIKLTYFGTLEGSIGVIAHLPKDTYDYLYVLQNEILKHVSYTGNFDFEKWRAFKDGFITDFSKGFLDGGILQEFLNFDNSYRIDFLKNLKYPWQMKVNETISLIESLAKLH